MKSIFRRQSLTTASAGTLAATAAFAKPARAMLVVLAMVMVAVMIPDPSVLGTEPRIQQVVRGKGQRVRQEVRL
ncbi:MAG: hypothetical protein E6H73_08955 [Betaproteobacteria bacterium]|nr:MAG: hypothetical protein E6H73_08955 [Betaproteobacteria bacterium]